MNKTTLQAGQTASVSRVISEKDIEAFAELSLDRNPVHFDDKFASTTIFGKRIAHGMVGAALISGCLTELLGEGNILLSASIKFEKAIYLGDALTCILSTTDVNRRYLASIDVKVANAKGETVISGSVQSMRFVSDE